MVTPLFLPGEPLTASKLQQLGDEDSYTPTLTAGVNPNLGVSPQQTGLIHLNGNLVTIHWRIRWGTSGVSVGSGTYRLSIPAAYPIAATSPADCPVGLARFVDVSTNTNRLGVAIADGVNNNVYFYTTNDAAFVTSSVPWTWATTDLMAGVLTYLTDFDV